LKSKANCFSKITYQSICSDLARNPGAGRDDAMAYATAGMKVRKAYSAWLNAS
jgi:hypothetical protein